MATPVMMPRQGQSVESCIIGEWHKKKGDRVKVGDLLFTYETDKATFDEEAKVDGTLLDIFFEEGDDVPVLTHVCVIGEPGEDTAQYAPDHPSVGEEREEKSEKEAADAATVAAPAEEPEKKPSIPISSEATEGTAGISPRARHLAERSGADLRQAAPTGPKGRIIERDIRRLIDEGALATQTAGSYPAGLKGTGIGGRVTAKDAAASMSPTKSEAVPSRTLPADDTSDTYTEKHSQIRKVIARSMHASLSTMAQLTLNTSFDVSDILSLRSRLKKAARDGLNSEQGFDLAEQVPTLNDIMLFAVSRVLKRHPACNAHYDEEKTTFFRHVHCGVAIDTPRGLMVPTLFEADQMSLSEISSSVKQLAEACQKGTINPDLLKGGTFTVTNLGTLDIESFTPVINPPQTCILGVNTITTRVREVDGTCVPYPAMGLSLTFDHRAVDGAPAARFLKDLKQVLEHFSLWSIQ